MEYEYSEEERVFREEYYTRCGFGNTLFTDLPFEMQPPKIRNEIKALCDEYPDKNYSELLLNHDSLGQYISKHPEFYELLQSTEGIKEYRLNKDFCMSRNAYDEARETQINGMNARIHKMLDQASDLDCNVLMEKASMRDSIAVDIYSETVADLNLVLGQQPDTKQAVQKGLRINSVYRVGEHFGLNLEKKEAFQRLENVFDPQRKGYQPFVAKEMRNIFPEPGLYKDMDTTYFVSSLKKDQELSAVVDTLNSSSPIAVYQNKYGEKVFGDIKADSNYTEIVAKCRKQLNEDKTR